MKSMYKKVLTLLVAVLLTCVLSGCCIIHDWADATCVAPITCTKCGKTKGEALGHTATDATCVDPSVCSVCRDELAPPLGHTPDKEPTCTTSSKCTVCNEIVAESLGHSWTEPSETMPQTCTTCNMMVPMQPPENGEFIINNNKNRGSRLTIDARNASNPYYIKLKDKNDKDIISFYVDAGAYTSVKVPTGQYYVYFATGTHWYGPELLFGEDTQCSYDENLCNFSQYEYTYTPKVTYGGNVDSKNINMEDF